MTESALLPAKSAIPREVAAPTAKDNSKKDERAPGPWIAAPVKIRPRIGPAQGAQSNPVEIPSTNDFPTRSRRLGSALKAAAGAYQRASECFGK